MLIPALTANLDLLARAAVVSVRAANSRLAYSKRLREFIAWHVGAGSPALCRRTVIDYQEHLRGRGLAPASINQALAAIKALAREAVGCGVMDEGLGAAIEGVRGEPRRGGSCGRWLTEDQARALLALPDRSSPVGRRDYALLGLLFGAGLRRDEAVRVQVAQIQEREERPVIVDLLRKRGKVHTVPLARWAAAGVREWLDGAGVTEGAVLRSYTLAGQMRGTLSGEGVFRILRGYAARLGCGAVSPHDVRRTMLSIALDRGASMEQLRQQAGHDSIQTTERYLDRMKSLKAAACDLVDLAPGPVA